MRSNARYLVATCSEGRISHPLDVVSVYTAWVWLRELVPADAWFTVEEGE